MESVAKFFQDGGTFMWIIFAVGAFAFTVFLERLFFYSFVCKQTGATLLDSIHEELKSKNYQAALTKLKGSSPLTVLSKSLIETAGKTSSHADIESKLEEASIKQIPRLRSRLSSLGMFANVATLNGLLGTIFGLQESFSSLK